MLVFFIIYQILIIVSVAPIENSDFISRRSRFRSSRKFKEKIKAGKFVFTLHFANCIAAHWMRELANAFLAFLASPQLSNYVIAKRENNRTDRPLSLSFSFPLAFFPLASSSRPVAPSFSIAPSLPRL
jgi:hypothetical protein